MATKPTYKEPESYVSKYSDQIAAGMQKITDREAFTYDPLKDANYQAMSKIYAQQGDKAAKDTLGDAAALNGGLASSYAVTASQQVRNDYNQQLASQIPALQEAAYNRYMNDFNMDMNILSMLQDEDDREYGRHRDVVGDSQWQYGQNYQAYRDDIADTQWKKSYDRSVYESNRDYKYQKSRDKVADKQWAKEYALAKKAAAASSRSSSNGYVGSSSNSGISFSDLNNAAKSRDTSKPRYTPAKSTKSTSKSKNTNKNRNTSKNSKALTAAKNAKGRR